VKDFGIGTRQVWSSASSDGIGCGGIWNWCPSGLSLQNSTPWLNVSSLGKKPCSILEWSNSKSPALISEYCDGSMMAMCEVLTFESTKIKDHNKII